MRYKFILNHRNDYTVEKMCSCLKVSKNAYYHWLKAKDVTKEKASKLHLKARILLIFEESREIYGSARIQKMLEREGLPYCRSYIAKLMKEMRLKSILKRKFVVTTDSKHSFPVANNILDRNFKSYKLGEKWISDITFVKVGEHWNYLTTIMDLADRKIVGWALSEDMTAENTIIKAWSNARKTRNIISGFIFHSDRGVQYAANKMTNIFSFNRKITQSMSRKGNCWDNAVAESFFKTIKYEWLNRLIFKSYFQLYKAIDQYISWYHTKRLHSALGYITPLEMEIKLNGVTKKAA